MSTSDPPSDVVFDFDSQILSGHGSDGSEFGIWQPEAVDIIEAMPAPPGENEHVAQVHTHELVGALKAVGATLGKSSDGGDMHVELVSGPTSEAKVALATSCLAGSCHYTIVATEYGIQPASARQPLRFRVNHRHLRALVQICQGRRVELRLRPDRMRLTVLIDGRHVPVPVWPAPPEFESEQAHGPRQPLHGDVLCELTAYLAIFAERNDIQTEYSVASIEAGRALSGTRGAIGSALISGLATPDFAIKHESLQVLVALTAELSGQDVGFLGTERTYEFSTGRLRLVLDRCRTSFPIPPVSPTATRKGSMLVNRVSLREAVERLRLSGAPGVAITVPATMSGNSQVQLSALAGTRDEWSEAVAGAHRTADPTTGWHGTVPFDQLIGALKQFDAANVDLCTQGDCLIISDEAFDGRMQVSSLFGSFSEGRVFRHGVGEPDYGRHAFVPAKSSLKASKTAIATAARESGSIYSP